MFIGFQNLKDEQKKKAARLTAKAGLSFWDVSHIWFLDGTYPAVVLRFPSGVDALIQPSADII
jgi:hypothetical protein